MYRFYTYYEYIIIMFNLFWLKLQKWFSQEQWEIFYQCAKGLCDMTKYIGWTK